ncbi:TIR domain-containing protein [Palleronia sp. KMU-117]|uniref:TIR domain-containing protein n=1 Tax=Palleronia sp. KMU-117 TaxID=3434108 RepID=UPI003D7270C2
MSLFPTPIKRRVFFSFHYQNDIFRVNQVRNSWMFQHDSDRASEGFFDGSIWETSRRTGDEALKSLIREGIKNTSVTCVLAGRETCYRRWVRYEIARSIIKGNGLLTVQIHNLKDQSQRTSEEGGNPLDYMGVYKVADGRILLAEWGDGQWIQYKDFTQAIDLPRTWISPRAGEGVYQLSNYARKYCYIRDDGSRNFPTWVRDAAQSVGA